MALPSSGTISGSQIADELGLTPGSLAGTNLSLGGMIDSSSLSNTNPDAYSDFYGYVEVTSFTGSTLAGGNKRICSQSLNTTYYHDGAGAFPNVGDTIYTNSGGTTTLGAGYIKINSLQYVLTNSSGVVTNLYPCIS
jgi:hypothetical protein|tara:strand:- start:977 stop:1387 length:411 start_codon:yes stop_codon:yes gene_type:complete